MSDLNDFFAKKDRKKKKPSKSTKSGSMDGASAGRGMEAWGSGQKSAGNGSPGQPGVSASKALKSDDGWIELDEATTAKVNTGGRTVEVFKRDADFKDTNGNTDSPGEKFTGWSKGGAEGEEKPPEAEAAPASLFPSLADTTDAPEVPASKSTGHATAAGARPRRFINSKKSILEERNTQPGLGASKAKTPE